MTPTALLRLALRHIWLWAFLFAAGIGAGAMFYQEISPSLIPMIEDMFSSMVIDREGQLFSPSTLTMIIFSKNLLVAVICFLSARITRGILPGLALLYNGVIVGALAVLMHINGVSYLLFALCLLPHGIFELPALFLACAIGMRGVNKAGVKAFMLPVVMLLLAAGVEVFITPLVSQAVLVVRSVFDCTNRLM